jgi:hypothetical protein
MNQQTDPVRMGFRPIGALLPAVVARLLQVRRTPDASTVPTMLAGGRGARARVPGQRPHGAGQLPDRQRATERAYAPWTGRDSAPSGAPGSTQVRTGGEGSPSCAVVERSAGSPGATRSPGQGPGPSPARRAFLPTFDSYTVTTEESGSCGVTALINREGAFLFVRPTQYALLWPWTKV